MTEVRLADTLVGEVIDPEAWCEVCGVQLYHCWEAQQRWPWLSAYRSPDED